MSDDIFWFGHVPMGARDAYVTHLPHGVSTKRALLDTLKTALRFPRYFGHNWDALLDCLCDLSWIDERSVVVVHEDVPLVKDESLARAYLDILRDSVEHWRRPEEEHELVIVFPVECAADVKRLLG